MNVNGVVSATTLIFLVMILMREIQKGEVHLGLVCMGPMLIPSPLSVLPLTVRFCTVQKLSLSMLDTLFVTLGGPQRLLPFGVILILFGRTGLRLYLRQAPFLSLPLLLPAFFLGRPRMIQVFLLFLSNWTCILILQLHLVARISCLTVALYFVNIQSLLVKILRALLRFIPRLLLRRLFLLVIPCLLLLMRMSVFILAIRGLPISILILKLLCSVSCLLNPWKMMALMGVTPVSAFSMVLWAYREMEIPLLSFMKAPW